MIGHTYVGSMRAEPLDGAGQDTAPPRPVPASRPSVSVPPSGWPVECGTMVTMQSARVRAPELTGRGWLNTGGRDIHLTDLRGKIVLLDFWTFCCINCLHVVDELRAIEEKYADVLVMIGVHSPKFDHEKDPVALAAAVERYHVTHPVVVYRVV